MEPNQTRFRKRIRKEIERLKDRAEQLEGREREEQLQLIDMLERDHSGIDEGDALDDLVRERAWSSIITALNGIERQVGGLRQVLEADATRIPSPDVAQQIVDQFAYDCQNVEKLMKFHRTRGHLTVEQRQQLETQLRTQVETMMALFQRSKPLTDAVLRSFSAQLLSV